MSNGTTTAAAAELAARFHCKDVTILVPTVSLSLVSQPRSAAGHMVLVSPPSVTSSHRLLQLELPRETKRSFMFVRVRVKCYVSADVADVCLFS